MGGSNKLDGMKYCGFGQTVDATHLFFVAKHKAKHKFYTGRPYIFNRTYLPWAWALTGATSEIEIAASLILVCLWTFQTGTR